MKKAKVEYSKEERCPMFLTFEKGDFVDVNAHSFVHLYIYFSPHTISSNLNVMLFKKKKNVYFRTLPLPM